MVKFEFVLSDESAETITSIIRGEIIKMRVDTQLDSSLSVAEKEWYKRSADALEEDFNVMLKGSSRYVS